MIAVEKVEKEAAEIVKAKKNVTFDAEAAIDQLIQTGSEIEGRLDIFCTNLVIKKKIQEILKHVQQVHILVKKTFDETNKVFSNKPKE